MKPEKLNDAWSKVDCGRMPKCCDKPEWYNQFGSKECFCKNCKKRCVDCHSLN